MATSTKVHNQPPPPEIRFRPLLLSDLATLLHIHAKIFPHGNDEDPSLFYEQMLSNEDSDKMMTLGAVDSSRPDDKSDEIIGYVVTTKIVNASDSELADNIVAGESSDKLDNKSLVYVMWLGVLEAYRNRGIGTYLMKEVIEYASKIPTCVGIYLHAVAENKAAIKLYKKMKFKCVRRLRNYYPINGKLYDGLLFVHCLNGARCYRSPKDVVTLMLGHVRSGLKSAASIIPQFLSSMENKEAFSKREIKYRSIQPSDEHTLQRIHDQLFPIRYESKFYQDVANGRGTESWGAVDVSRSDGQSDELIGFVTTRIVPAAEVEVNYVNYLKHFMKKIVSIHGNDLAKSDETLVHVLTLGVVKEYRHHGIASDLLKKVIENASMIQSCRAIYLHSSSENEAAVNLYKKMSFKLVRKLSKYYSFDGRHSDAYLFVYPLNGGRFHRWPFEVLISMLSCVRTGLESWGTKMKTDTSQSKKSGTQQNRGKLACH
ncbi:hypothetical protein S245_051509 [Arachis hypogaea]